MQKEQLTYNQIAEREGWTRTMAEIAFPDADGRLSSDYNRAALIDEGRVLRVEQQGLARIRAMAEEVDARERAQRESQRQARLAARREKAARRRRAVRDPKELAALQREYQHHLYSLGMDESTPLERRIKVLKKFGGGDLAHVLKHHAELFRGLAPHPFRSDTIGANKLTKQDLRRRGWTNQMIRSLLHPPDEQRPAEDGSVNLVNYYDPERVRAAELERDEDRVGE